MKTNAILAVFILLISIFGIVLSIMLDSIETLKATNKLLNLGLIWITFTLYKFVFYKKEFYTDDAIAKNPIAVAIDNGCFVLASAIAISSAF